MSEQRQIATHAEVRCFVETIIYPSACKIVDSFGSHAPLAFVVATEMNGERVTPGSRVLVVDGSSTDDNDVFESTIQRVASATQAAAVVLVMEAWGLYATDDGVLATADPQDPRRQRILLILMDHRDGPLHYHVGFRDDKTLGPLGEPQDARPMGRFSNLLALKRPTTPEA